MINSKENNKLWVEKCINTLKLGGKSDTTIVNYKSAWNRFFDYFDDSIDFSKLSIESIINYFISEFINKNKCAAYYNVNLCAIRFLFSICFDIELNRKKLPSTKLTKKIPTIMLKEDFIKIFNNEKNIKHKCWLIIAFCSGLRVNEVANIKIKDINIKEHKLKVLGKGNKERLTILPDIVIKFLYIYCKYKNITKNDIYLFRGIDGREHINCKTIINYFTSIKKQYDLDKNINYHSLRHSFATYYLINDGDLLILKSMMGHKSLSTTAMYLHIAHNFNKLKGINYGK